MAPTRRNPHSSDVPVSSKEAKTNVSRSSPPEVSDTSPEVPTHVLVNFLVFTLAMVVLPLGSYFISLNTIFGGNTTYSAVLAALAANLVLAAFVIQAVREDPPGKGGEKPEGKKER